MRLRRADPGKPGYQRRRQGRGFTFIDLSGRPINDRGELLRLRGLVIPPAWREVWISPEPHGHIQAIGLDKAGRRQYLYHPLWRIRRDRLKFDHMLEVARLLPRLRERVTRDIGGQGLSRDRVLATVTRLLDLGMFRVGWDEYATGEDASFGLATLRTEHVRARNGSAVLEFPAKGGVAQVRQISDPQVCEVLRQLRRRRQARLFGYWESRVWHDVRAEDVNGYLRQASGMDMTAKDFRTWHATVLAARRLAAAEAHRTESRRKREVATVMRETAELLGNTPAIARGSYVDPRIVDLYHGGRLAPIAERASTIAAERAVLKMLGGASH